MKSLKQILLPAAVIGSVIIIGILIWLVTHAAGASVTLEPENGSIANPAQTVADAGASGSSAVQFSEPSEPAVEIRFASWNVGANNPGSVSGELEELFQSADIIGTQELSDNSQLEGVIDELLCPSCAYQGTSTTHRYDNSSPDKVIMIWKKSMFTQVDTGIVNVTPRTTVNDSSGDVVAPKFIVWARLKHIATGKEFYALNTHFVNGVDANGQPNTGNPMRLDLYGTHMDKMAAQINTFKQADVPIFITGDFNVNYRFDRNVMDPLFPYARMGGVGARSSYDVLNLAGIPSTQGTSSANNRLIDYLFHVVRSDVTVKSHAISQSAHGSDHYPYFSTVEIR